MSNPDPHPLQRLYQARFKRNLAYRRAVWRVLISDCFQAYAQPTDAVLDLGCGYGEFIGQVRCGTKYAMDLNPEVPERVGAGITCLIQDCSLRWPLPDHSLNLVFTSNFFEHLPDKESLGRTLEEAHRCLKPGGRLIALGPNIRHLPGVYWDFWDHVIPLTERSLAEALTCRGFLIEQCRDRFLPYTMANGFPYPLLFLRFYLRLKWLWRLFGRQFLVVAVKGSQEER